MIDPALSTRRVLVSCGTGGVGKTTLSAALALRAAMLGRRAVVITIDPAKRLATSLGLAELSDRPTDLTQAMTEALKRVRPDLPAPQGRLAAIVPDTRATFEQFVRELAPHPGAADRVLRNPIFEIFAKEFSGTNEYMALEKLYSVAHGDGTQGPYDLIVLDTPPSRNTLEFLKAPELLAQFFEERLIKWLVLPANKIVSTGMRGALAILEKLTGAGFMTHLFDFAAGLFEVRVKFMANLKQIMTLLRSPDVGFLMVAAPKASSADEALHFIRTLREFGFKFEGVALNRTLGHLSGHPEGDPGSDVLRSLQAQESAVLARLDREGIPRVATLPELSRDVHGMDDLVEVALCLGEGGLVP